MTTLDDPPAQAQAGESARRHLPGEEGLWVFILGDMLVFALFFGTIMVTRGQQPDVFASSQESLHPWLAMTNTLLLLIGSYLAARGVRRVRTGEGAASPFFWATLVCGLGFAAIKATEYVLLVEEGHTAGENDFFMYYFVFTGIHLAHLVIGVALMVTVALVCRVPSQAPGRIRLVECAGVYWHMVDLLWLVLFPLLYLVR